ncbi:MmgE/PrpD family protein [Halomonas sp. TRM85114]|uniref:MmgE/PrpD family protein n=1 Tax=Halomonas jincaotanensis TaxID=2810616 RepID=UPI001BD28053|nr:MmgE/PrpD family protein [Halomonas jincaotanensis]MBS9403665.1 MmgE/PrpD family protein [Halomonas jincaotanensis]
MTATSSPEASLANFATTLELDTVSPEVILHAKRSVINILACGFAGCREPAIDIWLQVIGPHCVTGNARLIGRSELVDPLLAAQVNAMGANIHDYDETHIPTINHPSGPVASALLALAHIRPLTGAEFLRAFLIGMEASCRLGNAISPWHYSRGWHITSTCGGLASALACAAALNLPTQNIIWALGNAAVQAAGMVEALGTMSKSISVGNAARVGLASTLLAEKGFSGPEAPLSGARGFLRLYGEPPEETALTSGLGKEWELEAIVFKPYPVGVVLNPVVDAAFEMRRQGLTDSSGLERVVLRGHPLLRERADRPDVTTGRLSQVSAQHTIAAVLLRGKADVDTFSDAAVVQTQGKRPKIEFIDDETFQVASLSVTATCRDGRELNIEIPAATGCPERPMSDVDIERKLLGAMRAAGCESNAPTLLTALHALESLADAAEITRLCNSKEP